jgi:hypothetical protein
VCVCGVNIDHDVRVRVEGIESNAEECLIKRKRSVMRRRRVGQETRGMAPEPRGEGEVWAGGSPGVVG